MKTRKLTSAQIKAIREAGRKLINKKSARSAVNLPESPSDYHLPNDKVNPSGDIRSLNEVTILAEGECWLDVEVAKRDCYGDYEPMDWMKVSFKDGELMEIN